MSFVEGLPTGQGRQDFVTRLLAALDEMRRRQRPGLMAGLGGAVLGGLAGPSATAGMSQEEPYPPGFERPSGLLPLGLSDPAASEGLGYLDMVPPSTRAMPPSDALPPASLAGPSSFEGGGGASVNTDPARAAGLGPPATPLGGSPGLAGASAAPGSGNWLLREGAAQELYDDPRFGMQSAFLNAGVNPFSNPYAQRAISRYGDVLGPLMDFFATAQGVDPTNAASMAQWVPQFFGQFMGGGLNPRQMVEQALAAVDQNPELKAYLVGLGPDAVLQLLGVTSGLSPRLASAKRRVASEKITRQRAEQQQRPEAADEAAWLNIIRGR